MAPTAVRRSANFAFTLWSLENGGLHDSSQRLSLIRLMAPPFMSPSTLATNSSDSEASTRLSDLPVAAPILFGYCFSLIFYGIILVENFLYFRKSKGDSRRVICFVYYLLILNTIFTAFSLGDLYDSFIREGKPQYYFHNFAPMLTAMALGGTLAFFSFRIYLLMYNIFIAGVVLLCSVITFVSAIMVPPYVQASGLVTEIDYKNRFVRTCTILWTSSAICGDVFVASSLVYFMVTHRTAVQSLRRILRELAQTSVATCIVTSLVQVTETCFLFTVPQKGWHLYLQPIIIRICTASALAALNMRANWNKRLNVVHGCTELSDFPSTSPDPAFDQPKEQNSLARPTATYTMADSWTSSQRITDSWADHHDDWWPEPHEGSFDGDTA